MNPITSSDFRSKNQVLFQTKIMQNVGWNYTANCGTTHYRVGSADVIDLNKNGKADTTYQKTGWTTFRKTIQEPNLKQDYAKLEEYAKRNSAEVVTQGDVSDLLIENTVLDDGTTVFTQPTLSSQNTRSISTLVQELEPFEKDAKWAIDMTTQEFLIYKPK